MELKRYSKNDEEKKRRSLALKGNIEDEDDDSESHEEGNEDDEIALLTQNVKKFWELEKTLEEEEITQEKSKIENQNDQGNSSQGSLGPYSYHIRVILLMHLKGLQNYSKWERNNNS